MDKIIKTVSDVMCPHCNEEFKVSFRTMAPSVDWSLKTSDIQRIKNDLIKKVEEIPFKSEEDKKGVIDWLNSDDTAVGPGEVDLIVAQIKMDFKL